ncbi:MAG: PAS domain S-box protein [Acetobacteraceae bacterium]|nr:PAS domain S-box protein [Acetobacteraceae bacterium]
MLDLPSDERFDRLTRLAQSLLNAPVAIVTLLDADRQFFLSARGLPEPLATVRETPLSHSLCRWVVEDGVPLIVGDARADARTRNHPAVQVLGVGAYFGVPLALPDGCTVGALCAVDYAPRTWTPADQRALADLADAVMSEFAAGLRLIELRKTESALRDGEARYRALIDGLGVAVYTTDADGWLTFYNDAAATLWGWRPPLKTTRWCGSWRLRWADGRSVRADEHPMRMVLKQCQPASPQEVFLERPDGSRVPIIPYPTRLRGKDGGIAGGVNVMVDITSRKAAEAALSESETRLRSILQTIPDALMLIDESGRIESFSTTAEDLFGYRAAEAVGQHVSTLISPSDHVRDDGGGASTPPYTLAVIGRGALVTGRRRDGSLFPGEIALGEVTVNDVRMYTAVIRDVTERLATQTRLQSLQQELLHVSRLSAAGEMASALAHELNQPMTAVASAVRAAERMLTIGPDQCIPRREMQNALALAAEQVLRAGHIVRGLRQFVVRDGGAERRVQSLPDLAEEALALASVGAKDGGVRTRFQWDRKLPGVLVDRVQIQQVLLNLIRNAIEAMTCEAERETPGRRELVIGASPADSCMIEVSVADSGPGLAPAVSDRLFDSFVSTKRGGMGMGLSISRTIIEAHGGRIWAENQPRGGAVFRFTLPAARQI